MGSYIKLFSCQPNPDPEQMDSYMKFFSCQRYSNVVLCTWYRIKDWAVLKPHLARTPPGVNLSEVRGNTPGYC